MVDTKLLSINLLNIIKIKKTLNIMLPAKPMAMAAWMRANLMA